MSDDRLLEARNRAARADALRRDEVLTEGFDALESAYIQAWRLTHPHDHQAREKLYIAVNVIGKLKDHLHAVITNGKIADAELQDLIAQQERSQGIKIN